VPKVLTTREIIINTMFKKNTAKADGSISTCNVCDSIYHWAKDCPNSFDNLQKKNVQSKEPEKFTLYSDNMKQFLKETCTKNVCGETKLLC